MQNQLACFLKKFKVTNTNNTLMYRLVVKKIDNGYILFVYYNVERLQLVSLQALFADYFRKSELLSIQLFVCN